MLTAPIPSETVHQTLTRALAAAQIAVKLDEANQDTMAIVEAYQGAIALMDDVIRRHPLAEDEGQQLTAIVGHCRPHAPDVNQITAGIIQAACRGLAVVPDRSNRAAVDRSAGR
jgi:uncharacterized protein